MLRVSGNYETYAAAVSDGPHSKTDKRNLVRLENGQEKGKVLTHH